MPDFQNPWQVSIVRVIGAEHFEIFVSCLSLAESTKLDNLFENVSHLNCVTQQNML